MPSPSNEWYKSRLDILCMFNKDPSSRTDVDVFVTSAGHEERHHAAQAAENVPDAEEETPGTSASRRGADGHGPEVAEGGAARCW